MKRNLSCSLVSALVAVVLCSVPALAQSGQSAAPPAAAPAAPSSGYRAEYLSNIADVEKKIVALAEAVPAEKFTWRPAEGVRSVSEVFLHIAGGNFGISRTVGVEPPAGLQMQGFDKSTTDKAKIIELLKQSFEHARQAALRMGDADLDKVVQGRRGTMSYRNILLLIISHLHEHLGQSIAYARMNGVVPPWSQQ